MTRRTRDALRRLGAAGGASLLLFAVACSKPDTKGATPTASASPSASGSAAGSASASTEPKVTRMNGKYTSSAGTIFVPDGGEWAGTKWRGDESKEGLGDGEISIEITGGTVHGSIGGPLGPAMLEGSVTGDHFAAHIARHDPKDDGFTGTLEGTLAGTSAKGTMRLARAHADVIREATFEVASK